VTARPKVAWPVGSSASRGRVPHWWQNGYVNHPRLENPVPATEEDIALTSIESEGVPGHDNLHIRSAWPNVYKGGIYGNCVDSEVPDGARDPTHLSVSLRPAAPSRYRRGAELPRAAPDGLRAGC
jgi:hypothetical protein